MSHFGTPLGPFFEAQIVRRNPRLLWVSKLCPSQPQHAHGCRLQSCSQDGGRGSKPPGPPGPPPTLAGPPGGPQLTACLAQELLEGDVARGMVTGRREVLEGI